MSSGGKRYVPLRLGVRCILDGKSRFLSAVELSHMPAQPLAPWQRLLTYQPEPDMAAVLIGLGDAYPPES